MPSEGTQFKNKIFGIQPQYVNGLPTQYEGLNVPGTFSSATFLAGTGNSTNPVSGIADVLYTATTPTVLIPDSAVPSGMRCYVTRCDIDVQGNTPWANTGFNAYCMLSDTGSHPLVYVPRAALQWGLSEYELPQANIEVPLQVTVSSFAAATGVITVPAIFTAGAVAAGNPPMNNTPFTVVAGTGQGQSAIISSFTATTVTPVGGAAAFPVTLDNTSVLAFWYWPVQVGGSATVISISALNTSNTFAANSLDNGFNLLGISYQSGAASGTVRPILSNQVYSANTSVPTITAAFAFNTNPSAYDVMQITNNTEMAGIVDMTVVDKWAASQTGKGIQFTTGPVGTWTAGSPLRIYVEGFFAV